jgi:hypothetical protein
MSKLVTINEYYAKLAKKRSLNQREIDSILNWDYYEDNLDGLFYQYQLDEQPVEPGWIIGDIITRLKDYVIPIGSIILGSDDAYSDNLNDLLESIRLWDVTANIVEVGAVTGTVGLKTVRDIDKQWKLTILPAECLSWEDGALIVTTRYFANGTEYIAREGWTDASYINWGIQVIESGKEIEWDDSPVIDKNPYGLVPVTVIKHDNKLGGQYGKSEITYQLKKAARQLAVLNSKVDIACQLRANPALVRKNDANKYNLELKPGATIDLVSSSSDQPVELAGLDYGSLDAAIMENIKRIEARAYNSARVTNPEMEREIKGGNLSRVAFEAFNNVFIRKVEGLRNAYGVNGIEKHIELIIKMGKALNAPDCKPFPDDYTVEFQYPPFFDPDANEKMAEVKLVESCDLPAEQEGRKKAAIAGITQEDIIQIIIQNVQERKDALKEALAMPALRPKPNA